MVGLSFLQLCEAGKYQPTRGNADCIFAEEGKFALAGATAATTCVSGTISVRLGATSQDDCEPSFAGTYSENGLPKGCPIRYFRSEVGGASAGDCTKCATYSTTNATGTVNETQCICEESFVSEINEDGDQECMCDKGQGLIAAFGLEACISCEIGKYKLERSNLVCDLCPGLGWTTAGIGSVQPSSCICDIDYFMAPRMNQSGSHEPADLVCTAEGMCCYPCSSTWQNPGSVDSTNCSLTVGHTLETLPIMPGFFRETNVSRTVRGCPNPAACLGGSHVPTQCAISQRGPLCSVCNLGYLAGSAEDLCSECAEGGNIEIIAMTFCLPILGILLIVLLCRRFGRSHQRLVMEHMPNAIHVEMNEDPEDLWIKARHEAEEKLAKERPMLFGRLHRISQNAKSFGVRFKILISFVQVMKGISLVFSIRFPPIFKVLLEWMGTLTLVDLDLTKLAPMGCLFPVNYFTSMLTKTAGPLFLVGFLKLVSVTANRFYGAKKREDWDTDQDGIIDREEFFAAQPKGQLVAATADTVSFYVLFIVYPSASISLLQFFTCATFNAPGDTGLKYMIADPGVDCDGPEWQIYMYYVFAMILVYPIGVCPDGV